MSITISRRLARSGSDNNPGRSMRRPRCSGLGEREPLGAMVSARRATPVYKDSPSSSRSYLPFPSVSYKTRAGVPRTARKSPLRAPRRSWSRSTTWMRSSAVKPFLMDPSSFFLPNLSILRLSLERLRSRRFWRASTMSRVSSRVLARTVSSFPSPSTSRASASSARARPGFFASSCSSANAAVMILPCALICFFPKRLTTSSSFWPSMVVSRSATPATNLYPRVSRVSPSRTSRRSKPALLRSELTKTIRSETGIIKADFCRE